MYIVRFLHQTTTIQAMADVKKGCISSVSYIKPQQVTRIIWRYPVVYRPFPTSNHNLERCSLNGRLVVYRPFPTSNHNFYFLVDTLSSVVYRPFPTSNHNYRLFRPKTIWLYIVRFLHQTTTTNWPHDDNVLLYIVRFLHQTTTGFDHQKFAESCISSVSYIKPQLTLTNRFIFNVVYRPFPTSNHNCGNAWYKGLQVVYRPFPTSNHNL